MLYKYSPIRILTLFFSVCLTSLESPENGIYGYSAKCLPQSVSQTGQNDALTGISILYAHIGTV